MSASLKRFTLSIMIALVATALLAGCGKRNKLEPPEGGTEYPRIYPSR
jgi:uncharacterized lipoprotein YajG